MSLPTFTPTIAPTRFAFRIDMSVPSIIMRNNRGEGEPFPYAFGRNK